MKFAVVLLMAVAATATMVEEPSFGTTVLAELRSKMVAGAPLDELNNILDDIKQRIEDAQTADNEALEADATYCSQQEASAKANRGVAAAASASAESDRVTAVQNIETAKAEIARREKMIAENDRVIKQNQDDLAQLRADREVEKEVFANNTRDSTICINAIDKIKELPALSTLVKNQDRDASDFEAERKMDENEGQEGVSVKGVRSLLENTAKSISSPTLANLVELAAVSMATLKGDVSDMIQLLDDLRKEMVDYRDEIAADEVEDKAAFEKAQSAFEKLISDEQADRTNNLEEKQTATETRDINIGRRDDAIENKQLADEEVASIDAYIADLQEGCEKRIEEHGERKKERTEELDTIEEIRAILNEKLGKHFANNDAHVADRMVNVTQAE